jgi:hypothetical protein
MGRILHTPHIYTLIYNYLQNRVFLTKRHGANGPCSFGPVDTMMMTSIKSTSGWIPVRRTAWPCRQAGSCPHDNEAEGNSDADMRNAAAGLLVDDDCPGPAKNKREGPK